MAHGDRRLFDSQGREVMVTMMCPKCHRTKPFKAFGLRKMADGKMRNAPWCTPCRSRYPRQPKARAVESKPGVLCVHPSMAGGCPLPNGAECGIGVCRYAREQPRLLLVPGRDCPPWECIAHDWDESNSTPCVYCYPPPVAKSAEV